MPKINLNSIVSGFNLSKINDNFTKIADALNNKVLYRDNPVGENNSVNTDVDVNGRRIFNLPLPIGDSEPVRLQDIKNIILGNNLGPITSIINQSLIVATDGQTLITTPIYALGGKAIKVYVNGVRLFPSQDYSEVSSTSVLLNNPLISGDEVFIETVQSLPFGVSGITANSVSTIKKVIPIFDSSNTLVGYLPVYTTYS